MQHGLQRNSGWRGSGGNGWFRVQDRRLCGGARGGVRGEAVGRGCLLQHVRRRRRGSTRQPSLSGAHLHGVVFKYVAPAWHSPRSCNKEHVTTMLQEKRFSMQRNDAAGETMLQEKRGGGVLQPGVCVGFQRFFERDRTGAPTIEDRTRACGSTRGTTRLREV